MVTMELNQEFNEYKLNELPLGELKSGDRYAVSVGDDKYKSFVISNDNKLIGDNGNNFIEKNTMNDLRHLSAKELWALEVGIYKGVRLFGYHKKGSTPVPIEYFVELTDAEDNGGSVIKVGNITLVHNFNNVVNSLYFGVDESNADNKVFINNAIAYCNTFVITNHECSIDLTFPATSKGYKTSGGHKVGRYINVIMEGMIIDITTITNVCFEIGDPLLAGANPNRKHLIRLKRANDARTTFVDEADVGVLIHNDYYSNSEIDYVRGFGVGFKLSGSGFGSSYNKYTLGLLANNYIGIHLYRDINGWVNENTFIGGEFTVYSNLKSNPKVGVKMSSNGTYYNNSNLFIKPSFEGYNNLEEPNSFCAIITGSYNSITEARNELGSTYGEMISIKEVGEGSGNNTYHFAYCDSFPLISSEAPNQNSIIEVQDGDFQYKTVKLYDSGNIASKIWISQNRWWANEFSFCMLSNGSIASSSVAGGGMTIVDNKYISTYDCPAVVIDTNAMKKISYDLIADAGFTNARVYFKLYDASDVEITDIKDIKGGGTRLSSFGGCFGPSQNVFPFKKGLRNVAVSNNVKKVIIFFSSDRLRSFSIHTSDLKHGAVYSGISTVIPTPSDYNKVKIINNLDYTLLITDEIIELQGVTSDKVITLPAPSTMPIGKRFTIKAAAAHNYKVTISGGGGIDGVGTYVLNSQYATLTIYSNGSSWKFFNQYNNATTSTVGAVKQSAAIADIVAPVATDLATALTLLNELRTKFQAELTSDRISGQRLT